jgi:hypothetical protein
MRAGAIAPQCHLSRPSLRTRSEHCFCFYSIYSRFSKLTLLLISCAYAIQPRLLPHHCC